LLPQNDKDNLIMSQTIPQNAIDWNHFFNLAAIIALVALSVVVAAMIYFTIRYRERRGQPPFIAPRRLKSRARDAIIFAVISIIILFSVTVAGDRLTPNARFQPSVEQSFVVHVKAYQWGFDFTYPNNATTRGYLNLPADTVVMFNVTSLDVMHNFFLVDFKVSIDAIPGRDNVIWITTPAVNGNSTISYQIVCKELCGTGHTGMRAPMTIMNQATFNSWLSSQNTTASATAGGI
jgi:cytochrome c oxidase subunit 2